MYSPFMPEVYMSISSEITQLRKKYEQYTMTGHKFTENVMLCDFFSKRVDGDVVECGTWKGGMACAMMAITRGSRQYHFFDSFEGLPDPVGKDGDFAFEYKQKTNKEYGHDNCRADYQEFCDLVFSQNVPSESIHVYRGWFSDTIRTFPHERRIAVLRLDGDFYESTLDCLNGLWDRVAKDGIVIVDDYDEWDGCTQAVHEFLAARPVPSRIYKTPLAQVAYIIKAE